MNCYLDALAVERSTDLPAHLHDLANDHGDGGIV